MVAGLTCKIFELAGDVTSPTYCHPNFEGFVPSFISGTSSSRVWWIKKIKKIKKKDVWKFISVSKHILCVFEVRNIVKPYKG